MVTNSYLISFPKHMVQIPQILYLSKQMELEQ